MKRPGGNVCNKNRPAAKQAHVQPWLGAGEMLFWRRWDPVLAQVRFLAGDLRHESCAHALPWRRSHLFFHTCASAPHHLHQCAPPPAPMYPVTCTSVRHHLLQRTLSPGTSHSTTSVSVLRHLHQCLEIVRRAHLGASSAFLPGAYFFHFACCWEPCNFF